MSPILQPQQDFPIVRQIANHLDATTYYVEAVVRDADGVLLDRVQLVSQGDQRYQKRYRVPVDRNGFGSYISIVTSVYTDSGYTTKSSNYGDEENTYLVFDRLLNRGGGGYSGPDASDIRRIFREEFEKQKEAEDDTEEAEAPEPIEIPDYTAELKKLSVSLSEILVSVKKIPTKEVDIYPVLEGIQNLAVAIDEKEVTPETELEPILDGIREVSDKLTEQFNVEKKGMEDFKTELKEIVIEEINNIEFTQEVPVSKIGIKRAEKQQQEQPKQFDLRKFVS